MLAQQRGTQTEREKRQYERRTTRPLSGDHDSRSPSNSSCFPFVSNLKPTANADRQGPRVSDAAHQSTVALGIKIDELRHYMYIPTLFIYFETDGLGWQDGVKLRHTYIWWVGWVCSCVWPWKSRNVTPKKEAFGK